MGQTWTWHVVVTCYNYGRWLRSAVDSAVEAGADLVTIVDDASTDETQDVAAEAVRFYGGAARLVTMPTNSGPGAARNAGAVGVDSDGLVFLDADDKLGSGYLREAARLISRGADVVYPDQTEFGTRLSHAVSLREWRAPLAYEVNTVVCSAAHRRSIWAALGGFDPEIVYAWEDWDYWLRALEAGYRFEYLHGLHFYRRVHGRSWGDRTRGDWEAAHAELSARHPDLAALDRVRRWAIVEGL